MNASKERSTRYLNLRLDRPSRALLVVAGLLIGAACFLPIWKIDVVTASDSGRLGLSLYANRVEVAGGPEEGVELRRDESPDSRWLPFVLGGLALLLLRGAAIGTGRSLVDLSALFAYLTAFSAWSYAGRLDFYGRYLSAATPEGVAIFVPPLVGHARFEGLDVSSLPAAGAFAIAAAGLAIAWSLIVSWKRSRSAAADEVRMPAWASESAGGRRAV